MKQQLLFIVLCFFVCITTNGICAEDTTSNEDDDWAELTGKTQEDEKNRIEAIKKLTPLEANSRISKRINNATIYAARARNFDTLAAIGAGEQPLETWASRVALDVEGLWPTNEKLNRLEETLKVLGLSSGQKIIPLIEDVFLNRNTPFFDGNNIVIPPASIRNKTIYDPVIALAATTKKHSPLECALIRACASFQRIDVFKDPFVGLPHASLNDYELARSAFARADASFTMLVAAGAEGKISEIKTYINNPSAPWATNYKNSHEWLRSRLFLAEVEGLQFIHALYKSGGWDLVNKASISPPISTEQLLHPELFIAGSVSKPIPIARRSLFSVKSRTTMLKTGSLGEWGVRLWIGEALSKNCEITHSAAKGWGGDRFNVFRREDGNHGYIWMTTWDEEADAKEFFDAAKKVLPKRSVSLKKNAESSTRVMWSEIRGILIKRNVSTWQVERRGKEVVIGCGIPSYEQSNVWQRAWSFVGMLDRAGNGETPEVFKNAKGFDTTDFSITWRDDISLVSSKADKDDQDKTELKLFHKESMLNITFTAQPFSPSMTHRGFLEEFIRMNRPKKGFRLIEDVKRIQLGTMPGMETVVEVGVKQRAENDTQTEEVTSSLYVIMSVGGPPNRLYQFFGVVSKDNYATARKAFDELKKSFIIKHE